MTSRVVAYLEVQKKTFLAAKSSIFVSLLFPVMMTFIFGSIMPKGYLREVVPGLIGFSILFTLQGGHLHRGSLLGSL